MQTFCNNEGLIGDSKFRSQLYLAQTFGKNWFSDFFGVLRLTPP